MNKRKYDKEQIVIYIILAYHRLSEMCVTFLLADAAKLKVQRIFLIHFHLQNPIKSVMSLSYLLITCISYNHNETIDSITSIPCNINFYREYAKSTLIILAMILEVLIILKSWISNNTPLKGVYRIGPVRQNFTNPKQHFCKEIS